MDKYLYKFFIFLLIFLHKINIFPNNYFFNPSKKNIFQIATVAYIFALLKIHKDLSLINYIKNHLANNFFLKLFNEEDISYIVEILYIQNINKTLISLEKKLKQSKHESLYLKTSILISNFSNSNRAKDIKTISFHEPDLIKLKTAIINMELNDKESAVRLLNQVIGKSRYTVIKKAALNLKGSVQS